MDIYSELVEQFQTKLASSFGLVIKTIFLFSPPFRFFFNFFFNSCENAVRQVRII